MQRKICGVILVLFIINVFSQSDSVSERKKMSIMWGICGGNVINSNQSIVMQSSGDGASPSLFNRYYKYDGLATINNTILIKTHYGIMAGWKTEVHPWTVWGIQWFNFFTLGWHTKMKTKGCFMNAYIGISDKRLNFSEKNSIVRYSVIGDNGNSYVYGWREIHYSFNVISLDINVGKFFNKLIGGCIGFSLMREYGNSDYSYPRLGIGQDGGSGDYIIYFKRVTLGIYFTLK